MEFKKEKSFPRGGKKPVLFKSNKSSGYSLFKKPKPKVKKKAQKEKQSEREKSLAKVSEPVKNGFEVKFVEDLKPSIVQDGLLVLGIVSKITEKVVNVSLPGGLRGVVTLANVSEDYKNLIETCDDISKIPSLNKIFHVGDALPLKILSVSEDHPSMMCSTDPKLINKNLSYNTIEEGLILMGSVKSQEDHGFVIDFGIEHVHGFLNFEKVEEKSNIQVRQLLKCCVVRSNVSPGSCSVQLSMLQKDLQSAVVKKSSHLPVYCFVPGFQFQVTVIRVLREGVEVSYSKNESSKGYIHEDHLQKLYPNVSEVQVGSSYIGTLLYVKPLVNFLYFKIMPKKELDWPFQFGEIVPGKVMKAKRHGVIFKLMDGSRKAKCFVPTAKLKNGEELLQSKTDISNLYPVNKKVAKIRVGNVDFMGRYYVGATDKASILAKYYSISDLKIGEVVSCKIVSFGKSSARLEIGKTVTGVVAFTQMTDVPMRNPTSKFKVGQKVKARVVEIVPETRFVRLTMKPSLLKEKEILCENNSWQTSKPYLGTIINVLKSKLVVSFFNKVIGVVPKRFTPYPGSTSLEERYCKGQLVKCFIIEAKNTNRLLASLLSISSNMDLRIGKKYKVEVVNKTEQGLFLEIRVDKNTKCTGRKILQNKERKAEIWLGKQESERVGDICRNVFSIKKCYLPKELLVPYRSLADACNSTYSVKEKFSAYCVANDEKNEVPVFASECVFQDLFQGMEEDFKNLEENSVLPFSFRNRSHKTNRVFLRNLIPWEKCYSVFVVRDDFSGKWPLSKHEIIYGKVLKIGEKRIDVSTRLADVWDKDFHTSLGFLSSYLKAVSCIIDRQKRTQSAYSDDINLGSVIRGTVEEVRTNHAIVKTEGGDLGIVEGKFSEGQDIEGKVVWIDVSDQMIYINANQTNAPTGEQSKKIPLVEENDHVRGKVVFVNKEVVVLELRGRGNRELAFFPRKRHFNDFAESENVISVGEELKLWITKKDSDHILAMDRRIVAIQEKVIWKKSENRLKESVRDLKRKLQTEKMERMKKRKTDQEDVQVVDVKLGNKPVSGGMNEEVEIKEEVDADDDAFDPTNSSVPKLEYDDVDIKSEGEAEEEKKKPGNEERIDLSSESEDEEERRKSDVESSDPFKVGFNWDVLNNPSLLSGALQNKDDTSSDEDEESKTDKKKRRRLTAQEKREKAKTEEERLRYIEERLMKADQEPETVDDFDRAVLANPDSSALWLKYMAFHIQGTEIEKAKAVGRRALKAISFREEQEKLNIWIALLNLENLYGNEDSLNKTLHEALRVNDPYRVHLHMLTVYGQGNKFHDMERLGNLMMKKYKDTENMWHDVAAAYFAVGKIESARNVLQKALAVADKSQHIPLISKFAQLENKYGSPERAQTLYESILASYPKRVDIWSCYVDMLVKSNHIDLARQVLERATSQSLRPRKMKFLFKKFIAFEEAHGTPENVDKVRDAAVEYVETVGGAED